MIYSVLSRGVCPDSATAKLTPLMPRDAATSDTSGFHKKDGVYCIPMCRQHQNQYMASRAPERCAVEGCQQAYTTVTAGIKLCVAHATVNARPEPPTRFDPNTSSLLVEASEVDDVQFAFLLRQQLCPFQTVYHFGSDDGVQDL